MEAYKCNGKRVKFPCYAEIKYDGEYNVYKDGKFINKNGKERKDLKALEELSECESVLVGELVYQSGRHGSLYELLEHKNDPDLIFAVFDIIEHKGQDLRRTKYTERRNLLKEAIPETDHVKIIPSINIEDKETLDMIFKVATNVFKFEGLVIKQGDSTLRTNKTTWIKLKNKDTADLLVTKVDDTSERMEVRVNSNRICGVKLCAKYKESVKVGDIVEIEYQGVLSGGGLRSPVFLRKRYDKEGADTIT